MWALVVPRSFLRRGLLFGLPFALFACGYRPLHGRASSQELGVVARAATVVDAMVLAEVEAGARATLARAGMLHLGRGAPRLVIEIVDIDTSGVAIAAREALPLARGSRVAIVAQAWIEDPERGARRAMGPIRVEETVAIEPRAIAEAMREDFARQSAARRLGERLTGRILDGLNERPPM